MAFHKIDLATSKYGRELKLAGDHAAALREVVDRNVARLTAMDTDAEAQEYYGITTLTRAQLLTTLTNAQTQLAHASISGIVNTVG